MSNNPPPASEAKPGPRPHRCNDRLEDIIQALFELQPKKYLFPAWDNFWRCMNAEPGQEPNDPYLLWTPAEQQPSSGNPPNKEGASSSKP